MIADVQAEVRRRLGGQDARLPDLEIKVFPTNNPAAALSSLEPDEPITVQVSATFRTMFPTPLFLPVTLKTRSSAIRTCEGN